MRLMDRILLALEGIGMALDAIRANKVRAGLTIAGVAIGVFVVVAMGATVHGIKQSFQSDLDEFGATSFQVRRRGVGINSCDGSDDSCPERRNPAISLVEWRAIADLPDVETATAWLVGQSNFDYRDRHVTNVGYDAQSTDWIKTDVADISPGRSFSASEHDAGARVVLVNDTLKNRLFGDSDPIGKQIAVEGKQFTVIGVFHTKAGFLKTMDGRGPDKPRAILPMMTAYRHLDVWRRGFQMMVKPRADVAQAQVMDNVTELLRSRRGLKPGQNNTFALVAQDRMMETFDQLFGAIFMVGLALSAVGLLVGGVGVVAIMMISVTERTREIGVRKALGATRAIILWQFLVEAATLTSVGASVGLIIGTMLAWIVRTNTPVPTSIPASAIITAIAASIATGIIFGMLPALRASRLDPVEALRHE
ncbi:ABC transporter permease [Gemmatimonas sp.]|uniref:ABC transporter permease n=1 Tax=Gemmatimonas sp. TaxID=1962908 RepID=UPI003982DEA9